MSDNVIRFIRKINWFRAAEAIGLCNLYTAEAQKGTSYCAYVRGVDKATGKMIYGVGVSYDIGKTIFPNTVIYQTI